MRANRQEAVQIIYARRRVHAAAAAARQAQNAGNPQAGNALPRVHHHHHHHRIRLHHNRPHRFPNQYRLDGHPPVVENPGINFVAFIDNAAAFDNDVVGVGVVVAAVVNNGNRRVGGENAEQDSGIQTWETHV